MYHKKEMDWMGLGWNRTRLLGITWNGIDKPRKKPRKNTGFVVYLGLQRPYALGGGGGVPPKPCFTGDPCPSTWSCALAALISVPIYSPETLLKRHGPRGERQAVMDAGDAHAARDVTHTPQPDDVTAG